MQMFTVSPESHEHSQHAAGSNLLPCLRGTTPPVREHNDGAARFLSTSGFVIKTNSTNKFNANDSVALQPRRLRGLQHCKLLTVNSVTEMHKQSGPKAKLLFTFTYHPTIFLQCILGFQQNSNYFFIVMADIFMIPLYVYYLEKRETE